jgi:hypothetical protein
MYIFASKTVIDQIDRYLERNVSLVWLGYIIDRTEKESIEERKNRKRESWHSLQQAYHATLTHLTIYFFLVLGFAFSRFRWLERVQTEN